MRDPWRAMTQHSEDLEIVPRSLQPGQVADVWIADVGGGSGRTGVRHRGDAPGGTPTGSLPPGTLGHLPDMDVGMRLVRTANLRDVVRRFPLFGG
jgi:hypothetical protein